MNKVFFILIIALSQIQIRAASADLVDFPSGDGAWTVDIVATPNPHPGLRPPGRQPQHVEVTQLNKIKRIVISWDDGVTTEKWSIPKLPVVFEQDPRDGTVTPFLSGSMRNTAFNFYLSYDSFAFAWVTPECLKEKDPISYGGKQCLHYVSKASPLFSKLVYPREAWIDAATHQPVAYDNGVLLSTFTFPKKLPTGPLVPPASFAQAIHYYKITMGYP